jgi:hypothetical protein
MIVAAWMKSLSPACLLIVLAAAAGGQSCVGDAHAGTTFDGPWSVIITTERGNCDPTIRLGVDIRDGALQYAGDSDVTIHGRVVGDGAARVSITRGSRSGSGSGRLSVNSGTGIWHGTGLASSCIGRWSAERR